MVVNTEHNIRVSSYLIPVRVDEDKFMFLHGYSGAMDLLDQSIAEKLCGKTSHQLGSLDDNVIEYLLKRGYLTTKTQEEERDYVRRMAIALQKKDKLAYSSYTIVVTYDCNFRCPYCFELDTVSANLRRHTINRDMVDSIYKFIEADQKKKLRQTKHITLFGGEPLLKKNLDIVEYIVAMGQNFGFHFSAITNGYDLEYFLHLLSPKQINSLQITIDGMESLHNSKRIHCLGKPTFKKIVENIGKALEKDIYITIRFNTDKTNFEHLQLLKQYFDELGYTKNKKFAIDSARLVNYDEGISGDKLEQFFSQKEFIEKHQETKFEYGCHDYGTYSKLYHAIQNQKPLPYKSTFCSAQTGGCVFDPLYNMYPCWEVIGKDEFVIGRFSTNGVEWNEDNLQAWLDANVWSYEACHTCKYALLCGGGCRASNINGHRCVKMADIIRYSARRAFINNLKIKNYERN